MTGYGRYGKSAAGIPGFSTVWEAHQVLWRTDFVFPFSEFLALMKPGFIRTLTYAFLAFYLVAIGLGFRGSERHLWVLPVWVAVIVLFTVSIGTREAVIAFTRLAILAWPAALLIVWRWLGSRLPNLAAVALCAGLAVVGTDVAAYMSGAAASVQAKLLRWIPDAISRLDEDEPRWYVLRGDFPRGARRGSRAPAARQRE